MEVSGQRHVPAALTPGRAPVPIGGGWVGPRAGLEGFSRRQNLLPPPWIEPWTFQPVASRYTYYAIPASTEYTYRPNTQSS
jgi:hypothetical protein